MNDAFRHLHMPPMLACEFLAVFSRMEYALKASEYAGGGDGKVNVAWDRFANDIDDSFRQIQDEAFGNAVGYLLSQPPRKQVLRNGVVTFAEQAIDTNQSRAQQTLLVVRTVRNNLFHGGKHLPDGEKEKGRNEALVTHSLTVLNHCIPLHEMVRQNYEH